MLRGYHGLYAGQLEALPHATRLLWTLETLVAESGLSAISEPLIRTDDEAWSAFVVIAESHVAIEGRGLLGFADLFSCAPFDHMAVLAILAEKLGGAWTGEVIDRTIEAPEPPPEPISQADLVTDPATPMELVDA